MEPELHLFIVWGNARNWSAQILEDLARRFHVLDVNELTWSQDIFSENMTRFYGQKLPPGSSKEVHCGRAPFLLITVLDQSPQYGARRTTKGDQVVNVNCFDAKERYRALTGGGHRIHATNSPAETEHDLMLLLGADSREYVAAHTDAWDGRVHALERDLTGARGWRDLAELLRTLNATIPYAVLRNFEGFPESANQPGHGDIDLLCSDMEEMRYIAKASPVAKEPYRVLHTVPVAGGRMLFDFRYCGDDYYDASWEQAMLSRRVLSSRGFYHVGREDYFYSLLYHALVHKPAMAADYADRLLLLSQGVTPLRPEQIWDPARIRSVLTSFLDQRGYRFVEPRDLSVHFNNAVAHIAQLSLNRLFSSSRSIGEAVRRILEQAPDCSASARIVPHTMLSSRVLGRHFSPLRHALLDSLSLPAASRVLELGAESGVVTRFLCERFAHVTAVEEDPDMARAISERCRGLANVEVRNVPVAAWAEPSHYDVVVLMVDPQSAVAQADKTGQAMQAAIRALSPSGLLVLCQSTAEGLTEAVRGDPSGSMGSPTAGVLARAPARALLERITQTLSGAGLSVLQAFYPFPNHLSPRAVFSSRAVAQRRFAYGYWAAFAAVDDSVEGLDMSVFPAAGNASAEGKLDALCSSVCLVAGSAGTVLPPCPWLVRGFSTEKRAPQFRSITEVPATPGEPVVRKSGTRVTRDCFVFEPNRSSPLYEGHTVNSALLHTVRQGNVERFLMLLRAYAEALKEQFCYETSVTYPSLTSVNDPLLRGEALDAIPQNVVLRSGIFGVFDLEWGATVPLPLSYILFRGLHNPLARCGLVNVVKALGVDRIRPVNNVPEVVLVLLNQLGTFAPIGGQAVAHMIEFENRFMDFAMGAAVAQGGASLYERYFQAVHAHAQRDWPALKRALDGLASAYPAVPQVSELRRVAEQSLLPAV